MLLGFRIYRDSRLVYKGLEFWISTTLHECIYNEIYEWTVENAC